MAGSDVPSEASRRREITVAGAGVIGLWQALTLARRGHRVRLVECSRNPATSSASSYAGAMLAPFCEAEAAPRIVPDHGRKGIELWHDAYPGLVRNGTLVLAAARDRSELDRFRRMTEGHIDCDASAIARLEPDLGTRFPAGLYYAEEAHMAAPEALSFLMDQVRAAGATIQLEADPRAFEERAGNKDELIIDCRGIAGADLETGLRAVRGERVIVRTQDITLNRPVRLLHPRHPIYVVPWGDGRFMVGATVIESEDDGPVSVRSMLELLGTAYALHPAFAEAEVVDAGAGLRPAFDDNVPRIDILEADRRIVVNGAYRHGFLLAPVLAQCCADYLDGAPATHDFFATANPIPRPLRRTGKVI